MLKGLILATGLATAIFASAAWADGNSIKIATEGTYAPWSFLSPDGKLQGYDIDATMAVCEKAGLKCELVEQDWEGIIPALQARKYDVIASSMAITKQRLEVINFTSPYAISTRSFVTLEGSELVKSLPASSEIFDLADDAGDAGKTEAAVGELTEQLKGKIVGLQRSTTYGKFLDDYFKGAFLLREYKSPSDMMLDLRAGRLDAGVSATAFMSVLMTKPAGEGLVMIGPKFSGGVFGMGVGMGVRKSDAELLAKLNAGLEAAIADGTLQKLSNKWFNIDISPQK